MWITENREPFPYALRSTQYVIGCHLAQGFTGRAGQVAGKSDIPDPE